MSVDMSDDFKERTTKTSSNSQTPIISQHIFSCDQTKCTVIQSALLKKQILTD